MVPKLHEGYFDAGCVDASFSNALDGLIVVDLTETDRYLLDRVMSPKGAADFLSYHGKGSPIAA